MDEIIKTKLGINLAWITSGKKKYIECIEKCKKLNITYIRIILSSWSLNALSEKSKQNELKEILDICEINKLEVHLTLMNFVDYNKYVYNDTNTPDYSWLGNVYNKKHKISRQTFFETLQEVFKKDIENLFFLLNQYGNIRNIELINECDQIEIGCTLKFKWINQFISFLKSKYPTYNYSISISNHLLYKKYKENIKCTIDLHMYSFPTESMALNILEYNGNVVGEFAKYSDYHNIDSINSRIYFTAGIWIASLLNYKVTPLHWWWDELLESEAYCKIIKFFNNKKFSLKSNKYVLIKQIVFSKELNKSKENRKIYERIINIIKHPLILIHELNSIKKFLYKKVYEEKNHRIIYFYEENIYFIETYQKIYTHNLVLSKKAKIYNLINAKCIKSNDILEPGVYVITDVQL
ncbi:MAG: hypothetical protein RR922_02265 [Clostridia bacterium]